MVGQAIDIEHLGDFFRALAEEFSRGDPPAWMDGAYKKCGMVLTAQTRMAFHNGASPSGVPWKEVKFRARGGGSGTPAPLRDTGELMMSLTFGVAGHVERREGHFLVWGTALVKATIHNDGGVIEAKRAKFLTIPVTKEAYYAGSPRNFPGKLFFLWNKETEKGVAIGTAQDYRKHKSQKERHAQRMKRLRAMAKAAKPKRPTVRTTRGGFKITSFKAWLKQAKKLGRNFLKSRFWKRITKWLKGKKKKKPGTKPPTAGKITRRKKKGPERKVHYVLKKSVRITARTFLELTTETSEKLEVVAFEHVVIHLGERFKHG